ncbi:MAG: sporulation protein YunB [Bacilli bacterium]|nr:sporulation protein YunB [Bacilli bacterium]
MKRKQFIAKKAKKKINIMFIIFFIIVVNAVFLLYYFSEKITPKMIEIAKIGANNEVYSLINNNVGERLRKVDLTNLLKLTKNANNEIVFAEYDLNAIYTIVDEITNVLEEDNIMHSEGIILNIPVGMASSSMFLNNLGPKIPVKVSVIGNVLTNIKTKMTNYGLNNVLAEVYVTLDITEQVIVPMTYEKLKTNYEILISTFFINGKVPSFYGTTYETSSKIYDVNLDD